MTSEDTSKKEEPTTTTNNTKETTTKKDTPFGIDFNDTGTLIALAVGGAVTGAIASKFLLPYVQNLLQQQKPPQQQPTIQQQSLPQPQQPVMLTPQQQYELYRQQQLEQRQREEQEYIESLKVANMFDNNFNFQQPTVPKKYRHGQMQYKIKEEPIDIIESGPSQQELQQQLRQQYEQQQTQQPNFIPQPQPQPQQQNDSSLIISDEDIEEYNQEFENLKPIEHTNDEEEEEELDINEDDLDENDLKMLQS